MKWGRKSGAVLGTTYKFGPGKTTAEITCSGEMTGESESESFRENSRTGPNDRTI